MNINNYDTLVRSLAMDVKRGVEVSFLFGSAISLPDEGIGMPSVSEMVGLIRDYLRTMDDDGLDDYIAENQDISNYQAAFKYLLAIGSQDDVKEVLSIAVNRAKDDNGSWVIPKAIKDFALLVSKKSWFIKNILTTNFDPFIEEALKESGYDINRIDLNEDAVFNNSISYNNDRINVVHLHGYYEGDTMHTPEQLTTYREDSISCIKNILGTSKLYVIGYGGWDDIINTTLVQLINERKQQYDIRWAYYASEEKDIKEQNETFFKKINSARARARFNGYKNVDCRILFADVYRKAHKVSITINDEEEDTGNQDGLIPIIKLGEVFSPQKKIEPINIKKFPISPDPAHKLIRVTEQEIAKLYLRNDGSFTLVSGLGYGKLDFSISIISDEYDSYEIYRVDCDGITNRNDMEIRFRQDIGIDFTTLVASGMSSKVSVIFFDNITEDTQDLMIYFNEVVSILRDQLGQVNAIFFTNSSINILNEKVTLLPLDLADIAEYVKNPQAYDINEEQLEKISRKSAGLPLKLDLMKQYFLASSVIHTLSRPEEEFVTAKGINADSIPKKILDQITEFMKSESLENKRVYYLLQILCIVECGESAENITKYFHDSKFKINDFIRLQGLGLTHSFKLTTLRDCTIHRANTIIKDYVKSKIDLGTVNKIKLNAVKMICGDIWYNRRVSISSITLAMLDNFSTQPGNAHVLLCGILKNPLQDKDFTIYLDAALSYAYYLSRKTRYKEVITFVSEVIAYFENDKTISYYRLIDYLTESMRMLDKEDEVISMLEGILEDYKSDSKFFSRSIHDSLTLTLLLSYSKSDSGQAYSMAEEIRKGSEKNSYKRMLCDMVLAKKNDISTQGSKLKRLEKRARNHGHTTLANNICLDLAVLDPINSKSYINTVLLSEHSTYTKARAVLGKIEVMLGDENPAILESRDIINLNSCYRYLFIQRIDGLFNRCHHLLWKLYLLENKIDDLFSVYLSSSLVWRVSGRQDKELSYQQQLLDLMSLHEGSNESHILYLIRRSEVLNN
ncbi:SIR2 family protein [Pantoea ananatis]|uniref:SIR2 family protein n=1 Tax=Pantoea ananas TaxID=553 RepID=UPI0009223F62|nr:SIR2 family protein [Pantoea ananatis]MDJ0043057.1 SIR2 family protein [Pantoea ananatis]SFY16588.1 SIR2-like domain-containing protein [Pantoea ananatis]